MKGLVNVSRERIKTALNNYRVDRDELNKLLSQIKDDLRDQYNTLTWWQKFWNDEEYRDKWYVVIRARKFKGVCRYFYNDWFYVFYLNDLIDTKTYKNFNNINWWEMHHDKVYGQIEQMYKAGGDCYLTPRQAELVNDFIRDR